MTITRANQPSARRGDIQGLRAVAVLLVIGYHAFPTTIRGGYVGVDVFFVISGFLITGLLLRELDGTGSIELPRFYARRIRRLVPAALTVTVATFVVAAIMADPLQLIRAFQDGGWATLSLANVRFGMEPGGYFDTGSPSYFLHYWSLSVEEQFYLVWPVLIIAASRVRRPWAIPTALGLVSVGTYASSIYLTAAQNPHAYYSLATRGWELGIGAGLAWTTARFRAGSATTLRRVALAGGLVAVLGSAFLFTGQTPFPGWIAIIPTLGAALMIWAGTGGGSGSISLLLDNPAARYIGDISYSLYLWHWPVLVIGAQILGADRGVRAFLVGATFLLAAASYRFVELPSARWRTAAKTRVVLATGILAALLVTGGAFGSAAFVPTTGGQRAPDAVVINSFDGPPQAGPQAIPPNVVPELNQLDHDLASVFTNGCYGADLIVCEGGDPAGTSTVVIAGDSHAGQWWPALDLAAREHGWKLRLVGKNGCALIGLPISVGATDDPWPDCDRWQSEAVKAVADLHPDVIVLANNTAGYRSKASLRDGFYERWETSAVATLKRLVPVAPVLMIGQLPTLRQQPGECLANHILNAPACGVAAVVAVPAEIRDLNLRIAKGGGAALIDPVPALCDDTCAVLAGNVIVYRDASHLTASYTRLFAPAFAAAIGQALR